VFVTFGCVLYLQTLNDYTNERKDNNWNSLLRHSSDYEKARKKKNPQTNLESPLNQRKNMEFFFSGTICAHIPKARGEPGESEGLVGCGSSQWCERS